MINPIGTHVLISPVNDIPRDEHGHALTNSGLSLVSLRPPDEPEQGVILSIGKQCTALDASNRGSIAYYALKDTVEIEHANERYLLIREADILGVQA